MGSLRTSSPISPCFRDLDVIARNSTAVYKSKPTDVRQVGRNSGVSYVLEGSI